MVLTMQKSKFFVLLVMFSFMLNLGLPNQAQAAYSNITSNSKIKKAIKVLKKNDYKETVDALKGDNLSNKPIKVEFTSLAMLSPEYMHYNALACRDEYGQLFIFIDNSHRKAPAEAIASLLTHEVLHQDDDNSIEEETQAWTNEAKSWIKLTKKNAKLKNSDCALVERLNRLSTMYKQANNTNEFIRAEVAQNLGYSELAAHSEGF